MIRDDQHAHRHGRAVEKHHGAQPQPRSISSPIVSPRGHDERHHRQTTTQIDVAIR
jgi:hypothetical protein